MGIIERNTDVKIKCYKCGNEYSMSMMRMDPNGKNLACRNCLERKIVHKSEIPIKTETKNQKQEESHIREYFCKECKYNFKRAKHIVVSTCPYCGSSGTVISKGSTARIMAEAFKMKGD
mgnify:CR=1 FL=1